MLANTRDHKSRGYVIEVGGAATPKPITPDGTEPVRWWTLPISPDGKRFIARAADGTIQIFRVDGSGGVRAPGLADPDVPIEWAADGAALFVGRLEGGAWRVRRADVTSGEQRPWMDVAPPDIAGLRVSQLFLSPDGRYYVHSYSRLLTDLYVVDGLR
jgi:hypothetical protein